MGPAVCRSLLGNLQPRFVKPVDQVLDQFWMPFPELLACHCREIWSHRKQLPHGVVVGPSSNVSPANL